MSMSDSFKEVTFSGERQSCASGNPVRPVQPAARRQQGSLQAGLQSLTPSTFNCESFLENLIHIYLISSSFQFYQWMIITQTTCIPRQMLKIHGTQKYNAIMISCFLTQYPLSAGTLGPCNLTKIRKVEEVQFTGFICISNCTECRKRSCINSIKFAHIYFLPF